MRFAFMCVLLVFFICGSSCVYLDGEDARAASQSNLHQVSNLANPQMKDAK